MSNTPPCDYRALTANRPDLRRFFPLLKEEANKVIEEAHFTEAQKVLLCALFNKPETTRLTLSVCGSEGGETWGPGGGD